MRLQYLLLFASVPTLWAQLVPAGSAIPRREKLPVVFLNGYDANCSDSGFRSVFDLAHQVLEADGRVSIYFNNCDFGVKPPIERLGGEFARFLSNLKYEDGEPVTQVDVVAYSMGGLVVRSYLSGKQEGGATFQPPESTPIRKLIFIATPHFGTGLGILGTDEQVRQMTNGSQFLFDLGTWNQGTDDLRGVDALAIVGSGGTGRAAWFPTMPGFDDGVVTTMSGSIAFAQPGKTRLIPFCHTPGGGLITLGGLCSGDARSVAAVRSATEPQGKLILSFLNGTDEWRSVGTAAEEDQFLSGSAGLFVSSRDAEDAPVMISTATAQSGAESKSLTVPSSGLTAYADLVPTGSVTVNALSGTAAMTRAIALTPAAFRALVVKPGPVIESILLPLGPMARRTLTPGSFVTIHGQSLAAGEEFSNEFPTQLGDVHVFVGSNSVPLFSISPSQVTAVMPDNAIGLLPLKLQNANGTHTVNVLFEPVAPAIFTQDQSGAGPASALNLRNYELVTQTNPLRQGDYLQLWVTGLGATTNVDGADVANQQPSVTISGRDCSVSFAGRVPGYKGIDIIECAVPSGLGHDPAAPVVVTSGSRTSNTATVAVE